MKLTNSHYTGSKGRKSLIDLEIPNQYNGELIVFVHGFMGFKDWGAWHLVQQFFSERNYGFCKFNLSHNGGTIENGIDFPDEQAFGHNCYSYEIADIESALKWLTQENVEWKELHFIGHSRGGGDVLLAGRNLQEKYSIGSIHTWAAISDIGMRFPLDEAHETWRKEGVRYIENSRTHQKLPQYFSLYLDFEQHADALSIRKAIAALTMSVFHYHGDQDTSVPISEGYDLAEWNQTELQVIAGADHVFNAKHPWEEKKLPEALHKLCEETWKNLNEKRL